MFCRLYKPLMCYYYFVDTHKLRNINLTIEWSWLIYMAIFTLYRLCWFSCAADWWCETMWHFIYTELKGWNASLLKMSALFFCCLASTDISFIKCQSSSTDVSVVIHGANYDKYFNFLYCWNLLLDNKLVIAGQLWCCTSCFQLHVSLGVEIDLLWNTHQTL